MHVCPDIFGVSGRMATDDVLNVLFETGCSWRRQKLLQKLIDH